MRKMNLIFILIILYIIFVITLTGCKSVKIDSDTLEDNYETIDYSQYLKKIWVEKRWDGGAYDYYSFYITKIENGSIEGRLEIGAIAYPDFYFYYLESSKYLGELSGTIKNGVAECKFNDKVGNKGDVKLFFREENKLDVEIKYSDKIESYNGLFLDGNYTFRPYNLTDIKDFTPDKSNSLFIDLNSWGRVKFVAGEVDHTSRVYPAAYLTNDEGDVLYKFQASFQTGFKVVKTSIKDINNDGTKDIRITIGFVNDVDLEKIDFVFCQMTNGLFYEKGLKDKTN